MTNEERRAKILGQIEPKESNDEEVDEVEDEKGEESEPEKPELT